MADDQASKKHDDVFLAGFRARASVIGLMQLIIELRRSGAIDAKAVDRIRSAMVEELALDSSSAGFDDATRNSVLRHLDRLLGEDGGGTG